MKTLTFVFCLIFLSISFFTTTAQSASCTGAALIEGITSDSYNICPGNANVYYGSGSEIATASAGSSVTTWGGGYGNGLAFAEVFASGTGSLNPIAQSSFMYTFSLPDVPWVSYSLILGNNGSIYNSGGSIGLHLLGPDGFDVGSDDITSYFYWSGWVEPGEYTLTGFAYMNSNYGIYQGDIQLGSHIGVYTNVPEPSTMLLLGSGLVGLVRYGRRRFKK